MNIDDLKKEIPFKWRVQSYSTRKAEALCIPYIDARDVQNLLDEVCSPENWQSDFKTAAHLLIGGLGVKIEDEWIWKWDTGTESNIEKDKGLVSDALKRAGVHWGIGRFLYAMPPVRVRANKIKVKGESSPWVCDLEGKYIFDITEYVNKIWDKNNAEGEATTDLTKRMKAKHISSNDFAEKLAQYRLSFENKGMLGAFESHLMDEFSTIDEAHIVREFLNSAKPIIAKIDKLYKGEKK
jgi:hypothetical protein